jgi:hypothetical protein
MLCAQSGHRQKSGTCPHRVCSTCGDTGHSARECPSKTVSICNSSGDEMHQQHGCSSDEVCDRCQEHGHIEADCAQTTMQSMRQLRPHRNARSFECREHKCTHECKDVMGPKGHNKKNCPETMDRICAICEACGSSKYRSARSFECPEHTCQCTKCNSALSESKFETLAELANSAKKLGTVPHAQTTKPTNRRCQNRLAEPTVPSVESPLVPEWHWQSCSHPPGLGRS